MHDIRHLVRQALNHGIDPYPATHYGSTPSTCPDCGRSLSITFDLDAMREFPQLEVLSWIIVCNDCGDLRSSINAIEARLSRLSIWQVAMTDHLFLKSKDPHDSAILEILNRSRTIGNVILHRLNNILAFRSNRNPDPIEPFLGLLTNIWEIKPIYGGETERTVCQMDRSALVVYRMKTHYGVVLPNLWKSAHRAAPPVAEPEDFIDQESP